MEVILYGVFPSLADYFEVRPMSPWFPILPVDYELFSKITCAAVEARNQKIQKSAND